MRSLLWLVFVALVVLPACSGSPESSGDATAESVAVSSSSTTRLSTTTTAVTTTTTTAPTTTTITTRLPPTTTTTLDVFFSIATHGRFPDPLPGSGDWLGSGCSPGSDTLPDGIWWGYITDLSTSSITLDLACLRWIPDPNDDAFEDYAWVIENNNPKVRAVPVRPDTMVTCDWMHCPPNPFPYVEWIEDDRLPHGDQGREGGLWLYVNNGAVTEIGDEGLAG